MFLSSIRTRGCMSIWLNARIHNYCAGAAGQDNRKLWGKEGGLKSCLVCSDTLAMPTTTERSCSFFNIEHLPLKATFSGKNVFTWTVVLTSVWPGDLEVQKWWGWLQKLLSPCGCVEIVISWGKWLSLCGFPYLGPSLGCVGVTNTNLEMEHG